MNKKNKCSRCSKTFNKKWELVRHLSRKIPCVNYHVESYKEEYMKVKGIYTEFVNKISSAGIDIATIEKAIGPNELASKEINIPNIIGDAAQPITNSSTVSNSTDNSTDNTQTATNNGSINNSMDNSINPTLKATNNGTVDNSNNITNNINNTQNNQNNNQNVQLVAYGKEDISNIPDSVFIPMLGKGYLSVPELVEYIHFNKSRPENNNIFISNMRSSKINMYNGTKWIIDEIKNIVPDLIDDKKNILKDKYDELHEQLTEPAKKKFMRFYEDDTSGASKELNSRTVNMLYNSKDVPEETIKKIKVQGKRKLIKPDALLETSSDF